MDNSWGAEVVDVVTSKVLDELSFFLVLNVWTIYR